MAVLPYQPTYSVQPKYGFRYMTQPPIPNVSQPKQPIPRPGTLNGSNATPPPTMGAQETPGYLSDPFDDNQFGGVRDKRPIAQGLGYQAPASSIGQGLGTVLGAMAGVPFVGSMMGAASDKLDQSDKPAYGTMGTYDTQGNVFGEQGRAYDPITGQAVASYASPTDAYNTITSGYTKLRDSGEGIISSALGSYENSVPYMQEIRPDANTQQARNMRGLGYAAQNAGLSSVMGQARMNTYGLAPGETPGVITPDMLGFQGNRMGEPTTTSGRLGTMAGDIVPTASGPGIRNSDGTISTPQGTVIQIKDSATGEPISLISGGAKNELRANQEIEARTDPFDNNDDGGMSGFNVEDSRGNVFQTDSSGTAGAFTGGPTGMEDEYDEPYDPGGNDNDSGGK